MVDLSSSLCNKLPEDSPLQLSGADNRLQIRAAHKRPVYGAPRGLVNRDGSPHEIVGRRRAWWMAVDLVGGLAMAIWNTRPGNLLQNYGQSP